MDTNQKKKKPFKRGVIQKTWVGYLVLPKLDTELKKHCIVSGYLWNLAVAECWKRLSVLQEIYKTGRTPTDAEKLENGISAISLNYWLPGVIQENPCLQGYLTEQMLRQTLKEVASSFSSYFELKKQGDEKARKPETKPEGTPFILTLTGIKRQGDNLVVRAKKGEDMVIPLDTYLKNCLEGVISGKGGKEVSERGEFSDVTIRWRADKKRWQVSISVKYQPPAPSTYPLVRSIDLGAGDIAVSDSEGYEAMIPARRSDKFWMNKVRECDFGAKKCKEKSRRHKKRMRARRRILNHQGDQHLDHQKRVADILTQNVGTIVIGKGMLVDGSGKKKKNSRVRLGLAQSEEGTAKEHYGAQNTGYLFRQMQLIENKARGRGVKVVKVADRPRIGDKEDPSTKWHASRAMLIEYIKKEGKTLPQTWKRRSIVIHGGKGGPLTKTT
jgi:transposase